MKFTSRGKGSKFPKIYKRNLRRSPRVACRSTRVTYANDLLEGVNKCVREGNHICLHSLYTSFIVKSTIIRPTKDQLNGGHIAQFLLYPQEAIIFTHHDSPKVKWKNDIIHKQKNDFSVYLFQIALI